MNDVHPSSPTLDAPPPPVQPVSDGPKVPAVPRSGGIVRFASWGVGAGLNLLVLATLGFLIWWGIQSGWTVPKFSELMGNGPADRDDWCAEHVVPESACVECNADLLPRGTNYGWCKKHGVSECPLCHPDVAQLPAPPTVSPADLERAERALALAERSANSAKCKRYERRLQFASAEAAVKLGIEVAPVGRSELSESIMANGEIVYDQTRLARLSSRVAGTVSRVFKQVGDPVQAGEVLALVDAAEVGKAKSDFLQALVLMELRTQTLGNLRSASTAVPPRQMDEAETALSEDRIRLLTAQQTLSNLGLSVQSENYKGLAAEQMAQRMTVLGLPESVSRSLDAKTTTANLLPLKAPLDGVVAEREVVEGEVVDPTKILFVVADMRQVWLNLAVRVEDARQLEVDQPVHFRPDGYTEDVVGHVSWISTAVDDKKRTVEVRAELANPEGDRELRAGAFGMGRIVLRQEKDAIVVPNEAVHWEGCCHIVFVRDKNFEKEGAPKVYHIRKVQPGIKTAQYTEVIAGVLPGELVASRGSGALRTELLKNDLGDG